jgi:hypothetical protein
MFRGRNQVDGKWVTQEYDDKDMKAFLDRVAEFNKEAWKASVRAARELVESDFLKSEQEFQAVLAFFDKLALNTFSVVHNQSQNMRS